MAPHALASRGEVQALAADLREVAEACWLLAEAGEELGQAAGAATDVVPLTPTLSPADAREREMS
jgi:hypothetical protein